MKCKIEYYIRRKSDGKFMQVRHCEMDESEICEAAKEKFSMPIHMSDNEYEFSDASVYETIS